MHVIANQDLNKDYMIQEINISEIFASIQGEGPRTGQPTIFVRVFGCNLACEWCDSKYAVNKIDDTSKRIPIEKVINTILNIAHTTSIRDVTFTGGEPLIFKTQINEIMKLLILNDDSYNFHFETNGTIKPIYDEIDTNKIEYVVSPKLQFLNLDIKSIQDGDEYLGMLNYWTQVVTNDHPVVFKFVYENENTIKQIDKLKELLVSLTNDMIYLMPEGKEFNQKLYQECAEQCMKYNYKLGARLHTIIWGSKRGV